ncbi:hypothetical protein Tsubulata_017011 [Turnera subulata]|uniref:LOV domain-containing protein n=1 Tax=Turnera subulata TaxID=218843 RepID=A0A9Q0FJH3_9ROSI|nr:hypothetical protein Tsubulata_017011 [Turnera subulata]
MEPQLAALIRQSIADRYSLFAPEALADLPDTFTITDPCISGHPIVFASRAFLKMTGYSTHEVLGRNARLFQGPRTSRSSVMEIREAIREERAVEVSIVNYRKDGTPFWMLFRMSPVFGKEDGRVVHFVGVQVPILGRRRRSGVSSCDGDRVSECVFGGSCRREVCSDSLVELGGRVLDLDSADSQGLEIEGPCEANDLEKRIAATAVSNILSVLSHYSESTGRLVCGNRCNLPGPGLLTSSLNISLGRIKQSFVLMDPYLPDVPIVYASDAFLKLTGYSRHEVLGRTWIFLSGPDSDPSVLHQVSPFRLYSFFSSFDLVMMTSKDSSSFWNLLHISPIRNATGKIAYLVGVQNEELCKNQDRQGRTPEMWQLSVVGAVKVAVRSSSMVACSSK